MLLLATPADRPVSIGNICREGVPEDFNLALRNVLENLDESTPTLKSSPTKRGKWASHDEGHNQSGRTKAGHERSARALHRSSPEGRY